MWKVKGPFWGESLGFLEWKETLLRGRDLATAFHTSCPHVSLERCWIRGFTLSILTKTAPAWTAPRGGPSGPLQPLSPVPSYHPKCESFGQVFINSPQDPGHEHPQFKLSQPKKYKNNKKPNNNNNNNNIQGVYFTWGHTDVSQSPPSASLDCYILLPVSQIN